MIGIRRMRSLLLTLAVASVVLSLAFSARCTDALLRNYCHLEYVHLFLSQSPGASEALRIQRMQSCIDKRLLGPCLAGNVLARQGKSAAATALWEAAGTSYYRVVTVRDQRVAIAPITMIPSRTVYDRGGGHIEFGWNSNARSGVYWARDGVYRIGVRARCIGPEPAILGLRVAENGEIFEFMNATEDRFVVFELARGYHFITVSFTNDYYGKLGNRNLRLMEVWIEPATEQ